MTFWLPEAKSTITEIIDLTLGYISVFSTKLHPDIKPTSCQMFQRSLQTFVVESIDSINLTVIEDKAGDLPNCLKYDSFHFMGNFRKPVRGTEHSTCRS